MNKMKIDNLKIKTRTANTLKIAGLEDCSDICKRSGESLLIVRNFGIEMLADLASGLLMAGYTPAWLKTHAHKFDRPAHRTESPSITEFRKRNMPGFVRLTNEYKPADFWMRERALAQLWKDGIEAVVGDDGCVWRSQFGAKVDLDLELDSEEEEA